MKRLTALLLASTLCFAALGSWATNCEGGSSRGVFCGTGTRF